MNEWIDVFMPGRLCLFGEHTDWAASYRDENESINKGYAVVLGIDKGIYLKARRFARFVYCFNNKASLIDISIDELINNKIGGNFYDYVIASARLMHKKYCVSGATIICDYMDLPMKKGLASSAAICMAIIRVFNKLYNLKISIEEEMELAYQAEISLGSKCGRLDHLCAYGKGMRIAVFDGKSMETHTISSEQNLYYLLVDLKGNKNTKKILKDLNQEYPYPKSEAAKKLFFALGRNNQLIVEQAIRNIEVGNITELGGCMYAAQALFDECVSPFSIEDLSAPKLHDLLEFIKEQPSVMGAKGVGSQGDGMVQLLVSDRNALKYIANIIYEKYGYPSYNFIYEINNINAVIPIAGQGTRLYPFTKFTDKVCVPIYVNNKVYPALYLIINELDKANIKNVELIIREGQEDLVKNLRQLVESEGLDICVSASQQKEVRGFGGAITSSEFAKNDEFFLICLGDYIYKSKRVGDCTSQLVYAWNKYKEPFVTIKPIKKRETKNYGVVHGQWVEDNILKIEKIIEKPSADFAESELMITSKSGKQIYGVFGEYLLNNKIFESIPKKEQYDAEVGLTEYLDSYAREYPMYAILIEGKSFDLGNPNDYYKSFCTFDKE